MNYNTYISTVLLRLLWDWGIHGSKLTEAKAALRVNARSEQ